MIYSPFLSAWTRDRRRSIRVEPVERKITIDEMPTTFRPSYGSVGHFVLRSSRGRRRTTRVSTLSHVSQVTRVSRYSHYPSIPYSPDSFDEERLGSFESVGAQSLVSYRQRVAQQYPDFDIKSMLSKHIDFSDESQQETPRTSIGESIDSISSTDSGRLYSMNRTLAKRLRAASVFQPHLSASESDSDSIVVSKSKKLRFDPVNLKETHHPHIKKYGLITIHESKTPFPRVVDPVDAKQLRKKLQLSILHQKKHPDLKEPSGGFMTLKRFSEHAADASQEFSKKRKKFYMSEFTLAKQSAMNEKEHRPLLSLRSPWRENQSFISSVQSRIEFGDYLPLLSRQFDSTAREKSMVDESSSSTSEIDASSLIRTTKLYPI